MQCACRAWCSYQLCPPGGDRAAQCESLQGTIQRNEECIHQLRQENRSLYKRLSEAIAVRQTVFLFVLGVP